MSEIVPCDICGVVPKLQRSHSAKLIAHKCKDYHSGWGSRIKVIDNWNNSNSQKIVEDSPSASTNTSIMPLLCELHRLVVESSLQRFYVDSDLYQRINAVVAQQHN